MSSVRLNISELKQALKNRRSLNLFADCEFNFFSIFVISNKSFDKVSFREFVKKLEKYLEFIKISEEHLFEIRNVEVALVGGLVKDVVKYPEHIKGTCCDIIILHGRLENVLWYRFHTYHMSSYSYMRDSHEKFCMYKLCPENVDDVVNYLGPYLNKLKQYGNYLTIINMESPCCCCNDYTCLDLGNFHSNGEFWYDKPFWGLNGESIRRLDNIVQLLIKELDPGLMIGHLEPYIMTAITLKIDLTKIETLIKYVRK